jgi:hypothetical protein
MFKFTVQGDEIDEVVEKLKELIERLDGKATKETIITNEKKIAEFKKSKDLPEEFSDIKAVVPNIEMSDPRAEVVELNIDELDSEGLPWDSRIHSSSKAKVKNGTWKIQRGVTDETANKIKAEYRGSSSQVSHKISEQVAPTQTVSQVSVAPLLTMNSGHTLDTFKSNFPLILGNLISQNKVTQEYVNQLKEYFKVTEIWLINDTQKAEVYESFASHGLIQKVG